MARDRISQSHRSSVMHQPAAQPDAPQRRCPYLEPRVVEVLARKIPPCCLIHPAAVMFQHGDDDAVTRPHVVHQEIRIGMEGLRSQRVGNGEFPTIDLGSGGCGGQSAHVRSEEHTSELQSPCNLVCRLLLEKKKKMKNHRDVLSSRL